MYPNKFNIISDFGTLKQDSQNNTISVTIPNGLNFNPSVPILGEAVLNVGTVNAGIRARGNSSKYPSVWVAGSTLYSDISVTIPSEGFSFTQGLYCSLERISASTIRLQIGTDGSAGPTHRTLESQTITFVFSTFLSPLDG